MTIKELQDTLTNQMKYTSFMSLDTKGNPKEYDLINDKNVTGLLRDLAANTRELTARRQKKKEYTYETFEAFCIYHACARLAEYHRLLKDNGADAVMDTIYKKKEFLEKLISDTKKKFESGEFTDFRAWLKKCVDSEYKKIFRANSIEINDSDKDGNTIKKRVDKHVFFEPEDIDLLTEITADAAQSMVAAINYGVFSQVVNECEIKGVITEKQRDIICYKYNLGAGYELKTTQKGEVTDVAIADKLGVTKQYIGKELKKILEKLRIYMEENNLA